MAPSTAQPRPSSALVSESRPGTFAVCSAPTSGPPPTSWPARAALTSRDDCSTTPISPSPTSRSLSGFGSTRQLNRACREIFHAAPGELRARRRVGDRLVADGGLLLRLPFQGPLEWDAMLSYFAARAIPGVESVSEGTYRRTIRLDGDPGVIELRPGEPDELLLRAHLPHWEGLIHVVERARRIFSLDAPVDEAARYLAADPVVGDLVGTHPGLRVPGTWDPFETGVRAIVGQQVSVAAATTISGRVAQRLGDPVPGLHQLGLSHVFPSPQHLARSDLSGLGLTQGRARAVQAFAEAVATDTVRLDRSVSLDQLVASITAVRGLGPWTAQYVALRLGERDAFPGLDHGLRAALQPVLSATSSTVDELAQRWAPWGATAAIHLWLAG